ncbi:hypothetical protein HZS_7830 [Henneguya salminicola]|nr:hypothetical protein HZS_7830 [Henneguya salminicola]
MIAPEIALATLTNNLIYCLTGGLRITYEYSKKSKLAIDNTVYFIFLLVNVSYLTISPSNNLFINFLYVGIISFLYLIIPILKIRLYSYALERVPKSNTDPEQEKWKEYEFFLKRGLIKEEKGFCNKNIINNWFHGLIISLLTAFILNENIYNEFLFKYFLLTTLNIVLLSISNPRMDNLMSDVYVCNLKTDLSSEANTYIGHILLDAIIFSLCQH